MTLQEWREELVRARAENAAPHVIENIEGIIAFRARGAEKTELSGADVSRILAPVAKQEDRILNALFGADR